MIEVTVARLRSRLASILETARGGEPVVIRRHGARVAVLTGLGAQAKREVRFAPSAALPSFRGFRIPAAFSR